MCAGATVQKALEVVSRSDNRQHIRVVEIFSTDQFLRLNVTERRDIVGCSPFAVAIYNGPSGYLGRTLLEDGISVGVDDWGLASENLEEIYAYYGLSADSIEALVEKLRADAT